jgi:hypothetical protein
MQPFLCSSSGKTSGQNLEVLNIINVDIKTYKKIKNNQSMTKKLCAPHQEIKAILEGCFETKNCTLFHT